MLRMFVCVKGGCDTIAPAGVVIGVMASCDAILEVKGRDAIFLPVLADLLIPDSEEEKLYKDRVKVNKDLKTINKNYSILSEEAKIISECEKSKIFTSEDLKTMKDCFQNREMKLEIDKSELIKQIEENLKKNRIYITISITITFYITITIRISIFISIKYNYYYFV
jgi:hypothetical protein